MAAQASVPLHRVAGVAHRHSAASIVVCDHTMLLITRRARLLELFVSRARLPRALRFLPRSGAAWYERPRTNAGAPHKSGLQFTKSHILQQFRCIIEHRSRVDSLVEAIRCARIKKSEVSSGMLIMFKTIWKGKSQPPPFKADGPTEVAYPCLAPC
eukprot:5702562-Pleurochrysis_carterae.AAC.1